MSSVQCAGQETKFFYRGSTINFCTTFYGARWQVVQPSAAFINLAYVLPDDTDDTTLLPMTPPAPGQTAWTAQWDSRGAGIGTVSASVHSVSPTPCAVEDFQFVLTANPANLPTF